MAIKFNRGQQRPLLWLTNPHSAQILESPSAYLHSGHWFRDKRILLLHRHATSLASCIARKQIRVFASRPPHMGTAGRHLGVSRACPGSWNAKPPSGCQYPQGGARTALGSLAPGCGGTRNVGARIGMPRDRSDCSVLVPAFNARKGHPAMSTACWNSPSRSEHSYTSPRPICSLALSGFGGHPGGEGMRQADAGAICFGGPEGDQPAHAHAMPTTTRSAANKSRSALAGFIVGALA